MMRGPTLSPVAALCFTCAPLHRGKVPDRQQRQYTACLPSMPLGTATASTTCAAGRRAAVWLGIMWLEKQDAVTAAGACISTEGELPHEEELPRFSWGRRQRRHWRVSHSLTLSAQLGPHLCLLLLDAGVDLLGGSCKAGQCVHVATFMGWQLQQTTEPQGAAAAAIDQRPSISPRTASARRATRA